MKRTFQPSVRKRRNKHGFRERIPQTDAAFWLPAADADVKLTVSDEDRF